MRITAFIVGFTLCQCVRVFAQTNAFQNLSRQYQQAFVRASGKTLTVGTGKLEREWRLTENGLVTTRISDLHSKAQWAAAPRHACDWDMPGKLNDSTKAVYQNLSVQEGNDEGFTSSHLETVVSFAYPSAKIAVQYVIWAYPGAPGIRTQLRVKALDGYSPAGAREKEGWQLYYGHNLPLKIGRTEYLPLDFAKPHRRGYWGYFNDPGARINPYDEMLQEKWVSGYPVYQEEPNDWASGFVMERENGGIAVVKESHKGVNQYGHLTGSFYAGPKGLEVTGWGLGPQELLTDRYRDCWATWTLVYGGENDNLQLALKQFDRKRFPVNPKADLIMLSDTWGSDYRPNQPTPANGFFMQENAHQDVVLKEIASAADLGIDVVRIDDGWQQGRGKGVWHPNPTNGYGQGWQPIREAARKHGVRMGLWAASLEITPEEMRKNMDQLGGVAAWKLDFDNLDSRSAIEQRIGTARGIIKHSDFRTQINWCPEYNHPRYGWYFAREYGNLFFQNLQLRMPKHLVYVPYVALRQNWLMAKYMNLTEITTPIQYSKYVDAGLSDAPLHNPLYAWATGLFGAPHVFQLTQDIDPQDRPAIKKLISAYKPQREALFNSHVFPIGNKPDNASWTGFQTYNPDAKTDYLLIFRELHNLQMTNNIKLKFLAGKRIKLQNLLSGSEEMVTVEEDGSVQFTIGKPAEFLFFKYEYL